MQLEILVLNSNTWNYLTVCKQMMPDLFKNLNYKLFAYKSYMYEQDLALNNSQGLICHKTLLNQIDEINRIINVNSTWNHFNVCKQMSFNSFKNEVTSKLFTYKSYIKTRFGIK